MKATVVQFRRGRKTFTPRHFILNVNVASREEAETFVGKKVTWKSSAGTEIVGEIRSAHGNGGLVRAIFEKGLPGQARNDEVEVQ